MRKQGQDPNSKMGRWETPRKQIGQMGKTQKAAGAAQIKDKETPQVAENGQKSLNQTAVGKKSRWTRPKKQNGESGRSTSQKAGAVGHVPESKRVV